MLLKFSKFIIIGGSTAILNVGLLYVFKELFHVWYLFASVMAYSLSIIANFILQKIWAFRDSSKEVWKQFVSFVGMGMVNIVVNISLMYIFVDVLHVWYILAQIIILAFLACVNYVIYHNIIFKSSHTKIKIGFIIGVVGFFLWCLVHFAGITYGTSHIALHQSYVGDEQSPVNAALHILNEKDLLAFRNSNNLYYGPLFAVLAIPPVVVDFGVKYITGGITSAQEYKQAILVDWGGIIQNIRIVAVIISFITILLWFKLLQQMLIKRWLVYLGLGLFVVNYYIFEYSHFFKHWIIVLFCYVGMFLCAVRLYKEENAQKRKWLWVGSLFFAVLNFGVSYISIVYQIMWVPFLIAWIVKKDRVYLKEFCIFVVATIVCMVLIIAWHPHAFFRLFGNPFVVLEAEGRIPAWYYYLYLVVVNHIAIVISFFLIIASFLRSHIRKIIKDPVFWMWLFPGIVNFIMFGIQRTYEGRYMLPTIVSLLGVTLYLLSKKIEWDNKLTFITKAVVIMGCFTMVFHFISIIGWIKVYSQGPKEEKVIEELVEWQKQNPAKKILVTQDYLLGYLHTKEAYKDYTDLTNKGDVNLYKELMNLPPNGMVPLNVYYLKSHTDPIPLDMKNKRLYTDFNLIDWSKYTNEFDRIIVRISPRLEINQFDFYDQNITRIWSYNELSEQFFIIK